MAAGDREGARAAAVRMKEKHPDSSFIARTRAMELALDGKSTASAELEIERELRAAEVYDQGLALARGGEAKRTDALKTLEKAERDFPGTAAALRARASRGHVLILAGRSEEAKEVFARLLADVQKSAPLSRLALESKMRLAALQQVSGNREEAYNIFTSLLTPGVPDEYKSNAHLQAAGVLFEIIQRDVWAKKPVAEEQWDQLRSLCEPVNALPYATPVERARAMLMRMESFVWQGRPADGVAAGDAFLEQFKREDVPLEYDSVRFFMGEAHMAQGQFAEAVDHFRFIAQEHKNVEMWKGMDHVARSWLRVWECLFMMGGPRDEVEKAARDLKEAFPESPYNIHVEIMMKEPYPQRITR
jgi:tetratricopeptide (TPR) repeat protein